MTPGATIQRIRGDDYVVARISRLFPGPPPTIRELAREVHIQVDLTLHALLGYRANAPAVVGLWRDQVGEPLPSLEEARLRLRLLGTTFTANHQFPEGTETPYVSWTVEPDRDEPVVLPLSKGFRRVLDNAQRQRQRETHLEAIRPSLDALTGELEALRQKARDLSSSIEVCRVLGERHAQEVLLLEALDGLLNALLATPKSPSDAGDRADVERLRGQLRTLLGEARRYMLLEPAESFQAGLVAGRARDAAELRALVEAPAFVEHVRALAENRDIAPVEVYRDTIDVVAFAFQALLASPQSEVYRDTIDVVAFAFQALLASPQSEFVVDAHVLPMIAALAGRPLDLSGLAALHNPALDRAIRELPVPPPASSVLVILVGVGGLLPQAVGEVPGPSALAVGILQWAAPHIMARVASDAAAASSMAGRLYRALVTTASVYSGPGGQPLSLNQRVALLQAIDEGDLSRLREINWSSRFQSSPAWGAAIGVAGAICLIAAVQSDDASTLRRWSAIVGSGSTTVLGVSVALGRYSELVRRGIVTGAAGRALGVVGGVAAIVVGVVTAEEEYRSGDRVGMWAAIGGATAGALSVAGFLLSAGAATTATVAGAPLGVVLMVAGAVLGIGTGVVALVRQLTTAGAQVVFETALNHFGRAEGPYAEAASARPSLLVAFRAVQTSHHPVDFWAADPEICPQLFDLGFSPPAIAQIVDEDEAIVTNRLRVARRPLEVAP